MKHYKVKILMLKKENFKIKENIKETKLTIM